MRGTIKQQIDRAVVLEDAVYTFEPCGLSIEKICLAIACHLAKKPKPKVEL
jgi:hypothetical protein